MKKLLFLVNFFIFLSQNGHSQINKKNWLMGGAINFSSTSTNYLSLGSGRSTNLHIAPNIGYFFANKFAAGLGVRIEYNKNTLGPNTSSATDYSLGPFVRYYFLPTENKLNLFATGSYGYTITNPGNQNANTFSFFAGPVYYLNNSVGLEFSVGYSTTSNSETLYNHSVLLGIGFQIHLEKNK